MKFTLTVVLTLISQFFFAQTVLDKFDGQEGVTLIKVNKKMFQMMGSVKVAANDKETQQYLNLIRKLDNMKVFTTANKTISDNMKQTADEYAKTVGLTEMMQANDAGKNVKIWVKSGATENQIKELLVYSENGSRANETVLMTLIGDFELSEMAVLIDKMKIRIDLKKAAEAKN